MPKKPNNPNCSDNLTPFKKGDNSPCHANGGKASGEAKRLKKTVSQAIELLLANAVTNKKGKSVLKKVTDTTEGTYLDAIIAAQIVQALNGNTKAFSAIVDNLQKQERKSKEDGIADTLDLLREAIEEQDDE